jgi:ABC-type glycerol-3-phosphate transport system substrate-binding protein
LKAPQNWDELLGACDALNEQGIVPITIGTKYRWTAAGWFDYLNMRINGPQFHIDLMLLNESYTDERVMAVFDAWNELFEHNCFIEDPAAYSWQEALDFMVQGDAAMYLIGDFVRDSYPDEQEDDLDFFQFPSSTPTCRWAKMPRPMATSWPVTPATPKARWTSWASSARRK